MSIHPGLCVTAWKTEYEFKRKQGMPAAEWRRLPGGPRVSTSSGNMPLSVWESWVQDEKATSNRWHGFVMLGDSAEETKQRQHLVSSLLSWCGKNLNTQLNLQIKQVCYIHKWELSPRLMELNKENSWFPGKGIDDFSKCATGLAGWWDSSAKGWEGHSACAHNQAKIALE